MATMCLPAFVLTAYKLHLYYGYTRCVDMKYISGLLYDGLTFEEGYVGIEDGKIVEKGDGRAPEKPFAEGIITQGLMNCHTHVADAGLKVPKGISLEDLVAPPNGLKHRYLRDTPDSELVRSIQRFTDTMYSNGTSRFIDFREGGVHGCRILTEADTKPHPTILGRPTSEEYDAAEIDDILELADGIGLPSISDMDARYVEAVADHVHRRGKMLAIHASERIREDIDSIISLRPDFIVHMTKATLSDLKKCFDNDIPIVVCARSNMFFGNRPPVKDMIDAGVNISLGTDNAMLCSPDIREETDVFINLLGKEYSQDANILPILLDNGRKLLYHGMEIGINVGMDAEITVFPPSKGNPLAGILGSIGKNVLNIE